MDVICVGWKFFWNLIIGHKIQFPLVRITTKKYWTRNTVLQCLKKPTKIMIMRLCAIVTTTKWVVRDRIILMETERDYKSESPQHEFFINVKVSDFQIWNIFFQKNILIYLIPIERYNFNARMKWWAQALALAIKLTNI